MREGLIVVVTVAQSFSQYTNTSQVSSTYEFLQHSVYCSHLGIVLGAEDMSANKRKSLSCSTLST